MPEVIIESNGRLEMTAVYLNGEQIAGVRELFINMDENGDFDAFISYKGGDGQDYTKALFSDYLTAIQVSPPAFTEQQASKLQRLTIDSEGEIDDTLLAWNDEELEGVTSLFLHIKSQNNTSQSLMDRVLGKKPVKLGVECKAELTFRDYDDTIYTESVF